MSNTNAASADDVVIVGAGPAGLTAAYQLAKAGKPATVLESDSVVGGISRSAERDGWRFDIGGHRFFTKVRVVEDLWHEILPDEDFLLRPRMSRIYYQGKYFDYPLKAQNALSNLGPVEAARCVGSYVWARIRPPKDQTNLEGWVAARFGYRLYRTFFKTYTEKVWGVPATELPADWAAQRIKNLSLSKAVLNAVLPKRNQKDITSLIEEFQYPKYGPGMMWERCREKVEAAGTKVLMNTAARRIRHADGRAVAVVAASEDGTETEYPCSAVISSMPITTLLKSMDPPVPAAVKKAADDLHYRDFLTVALVVPESAGFPDNWIYIHSPEVKVGRIQNFGSWSPYLVKDGKTCSGLEYFVFEGDEYWTMSDDDAGRPRHQGAGDAGPGRSAHWSRRATWCACPRRIRTTTPTTRPTSRCCRAWLAEHAANVHPVGRNGMHKYNNQDHSMYTAMLTVENLLGAHHDVWAVNVEEDYHEESRPAGGPEGSGSGGGAGGGTGRDAPILPKRS